MIERRVRVSVVSSLMVALAFGLFAGAATALPGGQIAFISDRDANCELYIMNGDGTDQTRLTYTAANESAPAISPDGRKIAFCSDQDSSTPWIMDIYVMNVDGSNVLRLTTHPRHDVYPAWGPDGSEIAFASTRGGPNDANDYFDIYVMPADLGEAGGLRRITNNGLLDGAPTWSPDGSLLAWEAHRLPEPFGDRRLIVVGSSWDGSGEYTVSSDNFHGRVPSWGSNGLIVFSRAPHMVTYHDLMVVDPNAPPESALTSDPGDEYCPCCSPDGSAVAFQSNLSGNYDIWTVNADGTGWTRLTTSPYYDGEPAWGRLAPARLDKTVDVSEAKVGDTITYVVTATNTGNNTLYGVTIADSLPRGTRLAGATEPYDFAEGAVAWHWPTLARGEHVSFALWLQIIGPFERGTGVVNNTARLDAGGLASTLTSNTVSTLVCPPSAHLRTGFSYASDTFPITNPSSPSWLPPFDWLNGLQIKDPAHSGSCFGMSAFAGLWFDARKAVRGLPPLASIFPNGPRGQNAASELAVVAQRTISWYQLVDAIYYSLPPLDWVSYAKIRSSIAAGFPIVLLMENTSGERHAVLAFEIAEYAQTARIGVYDPNYPARDFPKIPQIAYDLVTSRFDPYRYFTDDAAYVKFWAFP